MSVVRWSYQWITFFYSIYIILFTVYSNTWNIFYLQSGFSLMIIYFISYPWQELPLNILGVPILISNKTRKWCTVGIFSSFSYYTDSCWSSVCSPCYFCDSVDVLCWDVSVATWCCLLCWDVSVTTWCCLLCWGVSVATWCCLLSWGVSVATWCCLLSVATWCCLLFVCLTFWYLHKKEGIQLISLYLLPTRDF